MKKQLAMVCVLSLAAASPAMASKARVQALQKADNDKCATPADWRPGDDVIIPTAGSCGTAKERVESKDPNQYCLDWFMCFRRESKK